MAIMYYEYIDDDDYPVCREKSRKWYIILKDKSSPHHVYEYLFHFNVFLNSEEIFKIAEWCDENLKEDYLIGSNISGFVNESDAIAFKLRWL